MKRYNSLAEAKKSLAIQILILTLAALLLAATGRLVVQNRLPVSLILSYGMDNLKTASNVTIKWQKEDMDITEKEVIKIEGSKDDPDLKGHDQANILQVTMLPKKAGKYVMKVFDPSGKEILKDEIVVGRFRTAFSKKTGEFTGDEGLLLAGIFYYLGLAVIMLVFFRRLEGPLAYSYEAILSCGVFIFSVVALIIEVPIYINHLRNPELYPTWQVLSDMAAGGKYFTILTAPLLIIFCILLIISNIELLRHEKPRLQNVLGLLLGFMLITGEIIYYTIIYARPVSGSDMKVFLAVSIENIIGITFTYFECILFSSLVCGLKAAKHVPAFDRDYILILGCGFRRDGSLPPLLRGRVDKAMEFWYRQKELSGKQAVIIPSGGQGADEPMAESQAMYRYMVSSGFPKESIILEDNSANTYQNMEFSKKIIQKLNPAVPDLSQVNTAFVTTNYHVFRSGVWAGLAGLPAEGLGSHTKWWFWPNAFIRECIGLLKNRLVSELLGLVFLILCFGIVTWLVYL